MARESTIQILYGTSATTAPVDLSDGEFAYAHGNKKLFIGSNGDNTALWLGAEILDEDTFSSDSDTALATQQSIKSYVDSAIGASAGVVSVSGEAGALDVLVSNGITFAASSGDLIFKGITASTSQIGVASYSSDNFAVSAGGQVTVKNGGIANAELVNSSVSYGGVSVALGSSDATPAFNLTDATNYPAASLSGTINTATQLNNNTVSYGGISVALGSSDATPAFNLTDATNYQTSNLSGTISNGQLDNSVLYFTDGTSSGSVALGATLGIQGTTNEVTVAFSGGNFTVGLPNDVTIAGNLTVNGTVTTVDTTNLVIEDPLIKLAKNNNSTDSVDIGFYGLYDTSGSQDLYAGLFRDQSDNKFRLFTGLQSEPTTTVNTGGTGYTVGTLVANISGGSF